MKKINKVTIRHLTIEDYDGLKETMIQSYSNWPGAYWRRHHIEHLINTFPEGQICILADGKLVGSALSIRVNYDDWSEGHTYADATGDYTFSTHDPEGDTLYGIDVFVHPDYRGYRLGRRLYEARKELCENLNLKGILFGGRIPNYHKYKDELKPRAYIEKVRKLEIYDPTLTFQLSNDFIPIQLLKNYMPGDAESGAYAVLLQWNNIYYSPQNKLINAPKTQVRLGLVQWQMRSLKNLDALFEQMDFFIDAVSSYKSDFVLFPEYFNAALMADFNHLSEAAAIRELAKFSEPILNYFKQQAISYNINIVAGSMPSLGEDGALYNVGYLCHRNGKVDRYEKLHVTPDEARYWGLSQGNTLKVFNTDCGKVGVLICYDVEFPELSRLLALQGMQILFVPFLTDTQNGFTRVRTTAMARAIENECYVAIAGSVGNLPKVHNMDIQYAQSAVFTPSDFAFPFNGIKAEATPNNEMLLLVDVNLEQLKHLHESGSVRNLKDRRNDLYDLTLKVKA